ncbi:Rrf2 family transcriptional regulator [Deminuibacter soli]|uniref:Rrf2 family transcriptional regulator n=1 Tax=Deminuibacter soli TaxID=2291815 RepID=A0A3E1NEA9_9BACT|nr:Rrf2 family transcriptional regulator [Deminuibacter soli]RFM26306.1 Rrf2 family transcriptional regulator [Deminuibacter soli]
MNNGRFAISMHILVLLSKLHEEWISSEFLAGSININPVLVRKELLNLREFGLIESKEGKNGGSRLAKPAKTILLSQVYQAVKQNNALLGNAKNTPNPDCAVGRQVSQHLDNLYEEAERALEKQLGQTTLQQFADRFD